jgi:hypothetical protein
VLRAETRLRAPGDFKVSGAAEGAAEGPKDGRPLRKGVADRQRRAEVRPAANARSLEARAAVPEATPRRQRAEPLCPPAAAPARRRAAAVAEPCAAPAAPVAGVARPRRVRALNRLAAAAGALLEAVSRQELLSNGRRPRDLRGLLLGGKAATAAVGGGAAAVAGAWPDPEGAPDASGAGQGRGPPRPPRAVGGA